MQDGGSSPFLVAPEARAPRAGEVFANPDLARTLDELGRGGKGAFYGAGSRISAAIAEAVQVRPLEGCGDGSLALHTLSHLMPVQARGGVLSTADLATHSSTSADPVSVVYRGVRVWELPPNTQGLVALAALGTLGYLRDDSPGWFDDIAPAPLPPAGDTAADGSGAETPSPLARLRASHPTRYLHLLIEALRFAFSDARSIIADPDTDADVPGQLTAEKLLSEAHSKGRFAAIDPRRATADVTSGCPPAYMSSDTISVRDADVTAQPATVPQPVVLAQSISFLCANTKLR